MIHRGSDTIPKWVAFEQQQWAKAITHFYSVSPLQPGTTQSKSREVEDKNWLVSWLLQSENSLSLPSARLSSELSELRTEPLIHYVPNGKKMLLLTNTVPQSQSHKVGRGLAKWVAVEEHRQKKKTKQRTLFVMRVDNDWLLRAHACWLAGWVVLIRYSLPFCKILLDECSGVAVCVPFLVCVCVWAKKRLGLAVED